MGTARGEEAYILEALPNAFSRPVTIAGPYAGVYGEVLKALLVGGDDALLLFSWPSIATLFSQTLP